MTLKFLVGIFAFWIIAAGWAYTVAVPEGHQFGWALFWGILAAFGLSVYNDWEPR